ncbi:MBL fold metallo-hydrolase [Microlunatus speluncae]|uniref:MBL fold metallo-hydrolase n=1 Tax=Microlunatus speluncae TaxID=2594267 RepID=UPI0012664342|nr:MBL fold metallo-hydrolase [Microlunatus speluncae]
MVICATCAVEYDEPLPDVCPICADERQWVPSDGQHWTDLAKLRAEGRTISWTDREPGLAALAADPGVGIGQTMELITTPAGSLLWDPLGYLDDATVERIRALGPVLAIAASHPHMYGVQLEWADALDAPVLVCEADREWLGRTGPRVELWSGRRDVTDGLTLHQVGGHFVGSCVALWEAGAEGQGILFAGDTVFPNPDRTSLGFLRSYPNKIPLSGAVVERIAAQLGELSFDKIIGNFGNSTDSGAKEILRRSADRHIGWVRGDFDHLT